MAKFHIVSLGCAKNTVDSESIGAILIQHGHSPILDPDLADLVIVNTCGFIKPARNESIEVLNELAARKKNSQYLIAAGCMTQHYAKMIHSNVPRVDGMISSRRWMDIVELLDKIDNRGNSQKTQYHIPDVKTVGKTETSGVHRIAAQGKSAYLKIADGCRRKCSYCSIPLIKGTLVSRSREAILEDAISLQEQNIKEIILIAQDTSDYGWDLNNNYNYISLIKDVLDATPDVPWLRMLYAFPGSINNDFIQLMKHNQRFLPYLDIPLQHADPKILKSMQRPANIEKTHDNLLKLRSEIPDLSLRTTFIVGYPGEGEKEFSVLLDFIKEMRFDRLGVFPFFYETGTPSAPLGDPVPEKVKQDRIDQLMVIQQQISLEKNQEWIGKSLTVLIEGNDSEQNISIGRSYRDAPEIDGLVFINGQFNTGDMIEVTITEAEPYDLFGVPDNLQERTS